MSKVKKPKYTKEEYEKLFGQGVGTLTGQSVSVLNGVTL